MSIFVFSSKVIISLYSSFFNKLQLLSLFVIEKKISLEEKKLLFYELKDAFIRNLPVSKIPNRRATFNPSYEDISAELENINSREVLLQKIKTLIIEQHDIFLTRVNEIPPEG